MVRATMLSVLAGLALAAPAVADWNPGDGYKMHYPQLPDPTGIDVNFTNTRLADDFRCTQTGGISDVHFWWSVRNDTAGIYAGALLSVDVGIWSDVPQGAGGANYSQPGQLLWNRTFSNTQPNVKSRVYGSGQQSFWDPPFNQETFTPNDHFTTYQTNIFDIIDPFVQTEGTIYWLSLKVNMAQGVTAGWKTSGSEQFNDTHVFESAAAGWLPNYDPRIPTRADRLDLAFVITPTPGSGALLGLVGLVGLRRRR